MGTPYQSIITLEPGKRSGKPTIRGMRITVSLILRMLGSGHSVSEVLQAYPELEEEDVRQALRYAAWLAAQEQAGKQFSPEQRWWLDKIARHIGLNLQIGLEDFEIDGDFVNRGGRWGAMATLGADWQQLLDEMNQELVV